MIQTYLFFHTFTASTELDLKIFERIIGSVLQEFKEHDKDEDKSLGLAEFATFAHWLYDSESFYKRALKDQTYEGFDDNVISQKEWECSLEDIAEDLCVVDKDQDQFKVNDIL